jgi:hypothetical protein
MYAVGGQIDTWCSPQPDTSSSISEPLLLSSSELLSLPPPSAPCVYSQSRRLYILKRIFSHNETHRIIAKTNLFCDCHLYFTCPSMSCVIGLPSLLAEASISVCCAEHCILQTSSHSRNHPLHPAKECPNWARAHHTRLAALGEVPICPVWRTQRRWLADRLLLWTRQGGQGSLIGTGFTPTFVDAGIQSAMSAAVPSQPAQPPSDTPAQAVSAVQLVFCRRPGAALLACLALRAAASPCVGRRIRVAVQIRLAPT